MCGIAQVVRQRDGGVWRGKTSSMEEESEDLRSHCICLKLSDPICSLDCIALRDFCL